MHTPSTAISSSIACVCICISILHCNTLFTVHGYAFYSRYQIVLTFDTYLLGYGMTETSGAGHYSVPEDMKPGSIGVVVGGSAWKVALLESLQICTLLFVFGVKNDLFIWHCVYMCRLRNTNPRAKYQAISSNCVLCLLAYL